MIISEKLGVIFVHIPRTGGWSIAYQLSKMAENDQDYSPVSRPESSYYHGLFRHASAAQIKAAIDPTLWNRCFKFAFVRNPWDRLASVYAFKRKNHGLKASFGAWLGSYDGAGPFMDFAAEARTQRDFLCDKEGNLLVDYVGHFETMAEDVDFLMQKLQPAETLHRHMNELCRRHYRRQYDKTSLYLANSVCAVDADEFGYRLQAMSKKEVLMDEFGYWRGLIRKKVSFLYR